MAGQGRLVVIGGGLSGAAVALQAVQDSHGRMPVTILEPRELLGAGLAYSTEDPDHRLNAPAAIHYLVPEQRDQFQHCYIEAGGLVGDPDAEAGGYGLFPRRRDLGLHAMNLLRPYLARSGAVEPAVRHCRQRALGLCERGDSIDVLLEAGGAIAARAVVVATGNRPSPPPPPFAGALQGHSALLATPWDPDRLRAIPRNGRVLILGTALTTADIVATLVRQGHLGRIEAVSRRGLRPTLHRTPSGKPPPRLWTRIAAPLPDFLMPVQRNAGLLELLRILRRRCREIEAAGGTWHEPFDELRDALWRIWPSVSNDDKKRFMRHLRPWYDSHRFRIAPQTARFVTDAEASGQLKFAAAKVISARDKGDRIAVSLRDRGAAVVRTELYDAVINCTGTVAGPGDDPFSRALETDGLARPHPSGSGWDIDHECRAIRRDGSVHDRLFVVGPPSAGMFGDPIGSPWIVAQIWRMLPTLRAAMDKRAD